MSVKAWLEGESHDLECLAEMFPYGSGSFWIDQQGGRYYLSPPELDSPPGGVTHLKVAERLIGKANVYASLLYQDFRPVSSLGGSAKTANPTSLKRNSRGRSGRTSVQA